MARTRMTGSYLEAYIDNMIWRVNNWERKEDTAILESHEIQESDLPLQETDHYYLRMPNDLGLPVEWSFS